MRSPLVVAHRGSSHSSPEHTLEAYLRAIAEGADGLECDVRLTSDGHLVCVHDRRVDRTSNGSGVVSTFDLSTLNNFDFSAWPAPRRKPKKPLPDWQLQHGSPANPSSVLTLEVLLTTVIDCPRRLKLFIETKHPTRYAGLVEHQLVRILRRFGLANPVTPDESPIVVMSFAPISVRRVRLLAPKIPTVLLLKRESPLRRNGSLPVGVTTAGPGIDFLREHPEYVARAHARGHQVYTWVANEPDEMELALSLGVNAIGTDRPAALLRRLDRGNERSR